MLLTKLAQIGRTHQGKQAIKMIIRGRFVTGLIPAFVAGVNENNFIHSL